MFRTKKRKKEKEFRVRLDYFLVPRSKYLVHTKMYIVDDEVSITGSANLTSSGMNKNLEHIEIKKEETLVKEDVRDFQNIWAKGLSDVEV
ncbi:MAG: hypothetical protein GWO20_00575 [Candidatus Korarchaeota archaeon]|nr:hypothetical protein [Candidatus Korarchaeota archaeon]NIU82075.1 hypothetical protein [Candidatus Thorarchaeota archaeon]NIW12495.1 hypothetical protein [Candidatus Thorarchaeota archaeon]NIW50709.1 hypothetical protein [Candidatus Korarchaeota archaeon]